MHLFYHTRNNSKQKCTVTNTNNIIHREQKQPIRNTGCRNKSKRKANTDPNRITGKVKNKEYSEKKEKETSRERKHATA